MNSFTCKSARGSALRYSEIKANKHLTKYVTRAFLIKKNMWVREYRHSLMNLVLLCDVQYIYFEWHASSIRSFTVGPDQVVWLFVILEHPGFENKMKIRNIHIPLHARFIFKQHRRKSKWAESMTHRFSSNIWAESSPMSWIDLSWIDLSWIDLSWIDSAHFNLSW
jgi:hypothetical protein